MYIKNRLLLLLLAVVFACSCATHKHRYLQVPKNAQAEAIYQKSLEEYHLQPNDVLYVNVLTEKEEFAGLFNKSQMQSTPATMSNTYLYLHGYPVDILGHIEMPLIGKLYVEGLTAAEVEKLIHEKVSAIVFDSQVVVRLAGFRINIVGEVKSPGEYTMYRDHATIMEAMSLAGDMNYYANRKAIMIYRSTKDGYIPYSIDLTDHKAFLSPVFYLQPNDLVYVQPLPRTIFRVNISDVVTYVSAISSSLALIVAIISLTK